MSDIALPRDRVPGLPLGGRLLGDERLAKLAGAGSERAFAQLYERHHQAIYRYCRSILRNDHDAQDAMQSAMMRAYAALRSRERELAVKPWLFRIAHNESISILRKRRPQEELSDLYEQPDAGIEGTLETRERLSTLLADLQALPERQRGALLMRELSGLSIGQIADALDMSPGAAKQALFEARNSLHELSEGRAMSCESVREAISKRDGRVLRSRRIRSHLRACEDCREFRAAIGVRSADLAALAPGLPPSVASALLTGLLAHGGSHSGSGAAVAGSGGAAVAGSGGAAVAGSGGTAAVAGSGAGSGALGSGPLGPAAAGSGVSLAGHAATASVLGKGVAGVAALAIAAAGTAHFASSSSQHRRPAHEQSGVARGVSVVPSANTPSTTASSPLQDHGPGAPVAAKGGAQATQERASSFPTGLPKTASGGRSHANADARRGEAPPSSDEPSSRNSSRASHGAGLPNATSPHGSTVKASHQRVSNSSHRSPGAQRRPGEGTTRTGARHGHRSHVSRGPRAPSRHKPPGKDLAHPPAASQGSSATQDGAATRGPGHQPPSDERSLRTLAAAAGARS